jgi:hypothetical protein
LTGQAFRSWTGDGKLTRVGFVACRRNEEDVYGHEHVYEHEHVHAYEHVDEDEDEHEHEHAYEHVDEDEDDSSRRCARTRCATGGIASRDPSRPLLRGASTGQVAVRSSPETSS